MPSSPPLSVFVSHKHISFPSGLHTTTTMYNLRRRTKLLLSVLPTSALLLILLFSNTRLRNSNSNTPKTHVHNRIQLAAHSACQDTLYKDLCVSTLSTFPDLSTKSVPQIISYTVSHTVSEVQASSSNCTGIIKKQFKKLDALQQIALDDCLELFDDTIAELKAVISDLSVKKLSSDRYYDLKTLLSGAMTNQYTCLDGFNDTGIVRHEIQSRLQTISQHVSNALVMLKKIPGALKYENSKSSTSSDMFPEFGPMKNGFPTWVSSKDRKLLQSVVNGTKYDLVVAKDGTGNFTTISEAVAVAPNSSATRFVIYIKSGAYFENVEVVRKKTNLMFLGDGIGKTVVKASRNVVDGWTTFRSATVAVVGDRFIAQGITFENAAGPSKHQAVAFRSGSDFSAFYKCSFVGYQDTLYVHSLRQFYRECDIYGTVDFIFGNAAVVLQNCDLYARKPNENQKNMFTAQGREDPNQNTGISILNSKVAAASDLVPVKAMFKTYLGRPWKEYSRTVYMKSYIDDLVEPAGWLEWNGTFALSTLYYGEYLNRGPGSNTSARVTWPGYRVINSSAEANQFTVGPFIQGNEWLNSTNIPYFIGLTP
ncbi:PREDICTED: pectinesterase [Prunus dulcis]|uniref:Pectinesterase n=1 Tax=Prunus dulcis TaxID=3755 RepID=A0A5E4FBE0_PRUDU|nr:pectinesterase-like [Prunus dulcis]VVA25255.1 PREDICTED: pectinesterase [Prunus dulcis]